MSNKKEDYYIYSHNTPHIQSMGEFVSESDSLGVGLDIAQLLIYQDENNSSNIDKVVSLYTPEELDEFEDLLIKVRSTKPNQVENNTTSNNNDGVLKSTPVENSATDASNNILPIRSTDLEVLLKSPSEISYLGYKPSPANASFISKLYNDDVKALFTKFLYRVETETDYTVIINNSIRTAAQQRKYIASGDSASEFSYHLIGLAVDLSLVNKNPPFSIVNKKSSNKVWVRTKVIKIADELKLQWGGRFKNVNPDPVHFDAAYYFRVNQKQYLKSKGIELTQSPITITQEPIVIDNSTYFDLPIKVGTSLSIPLDKMDRGVLSTETNQTINTVDYDCFLAKHLVELLSDKGYKKISDYKSESFTGTVQELFPHISVWVWSRALSIVDIQPLKDGSTDYDHKIINITPYLTSVNTNVAENGGNFSINLASITSDINESGWSIKEGTHKSSFTKESDYINQGHTHYEVEGGAIKRSRMFFEKAIQYNDVIFIKFEKLELEDDRGNFDELEMISLNDLPDQIFDMIGLVDDIDNTSDHASADVGITVSGRDLVKLIIEDGVYFYPSEFTASGVFSNTGAANSRLARFGSRGEYLSRFQAANKTIDRSLKFIINNLGTIDICPSSLFAGYSNAKINRNSPVTVDKRSRAFPIGDQLNFEQKNKRDDLKDSIIDKIQRIIKVNEIQRGNPDEVFDTIKQFISDKILNSEIVIENQLIKSWYTSINRDIDNVLPESLMDTFVKPNRVWLGNKSRVLKSTIITSQLETLYKKADKDKLKLSNLNSFKKLKYSKEPVSLKQNKNYLSKTSISSIISEIDSYLKNTPPNIKGLFKISDVNLLKLTYKGVKARGASINLVTLTKILSDLTSTEKEVFDDVNNLVINEMGLTDSSGKPSTPPLLTGIWQIIKLIVDDSVKDRRLTDPSIGNENGSILNAFRKICQDPFCEFYTDTYGSQFYFIARKKPFDFKSVLSVLEGRAVYEKLNYINSNSGVLDSDKFGSLPSNVDSSTVISQNLIIDIEESDVISDSLKYSTEAYSWYKLQLNNLTSGSSSDMAFAYLKAIYFEEYADIFGSKPLDLTTSYIPYSPIVDKNKKYQTAYFIKQGVYDLKYMIESHAHLPFTRQGTMTLNGERRIKRGNYVRLKGTDEIFYVDSVSQDFSIDNDSINRTTTIQVSRGMVERFIKGVDFYTGESSSVINKPSLDYNTVDIPSSQSSRPRGAKVNISYFNICNLFIDESIFNNDKASYSDFSKASTSNWHVNKQVFNFFLKKLQFAKDNKEIANTGINLFER
jgi:hypothetical protein